MKGLQVTVENTTADTRAEGLIRDLELAIDADERRRARGNEEEDEGLHLRRVLRQAVARRGRVVATSRPPEVPDPPRRHNPAIPPTCTSSPPRARLVDGHARRTTTPPTPPTTTTNSWTRWTRPTIRRCGRARATRGGRAGARLARALDDLPGRLRRRLRGHRPPRGVRADEDGARDGATRRRARSPSTTATSTGCSRTSPATRCSRTS